MKLTEFVKLLEANLEKALEAKTSWGRNDLKLLIKTVIASTLMEMLE